MIKGIKSKIAAVVVGAMVLGGSAYAMQCAPGKCGGSMKSEMKKSNPASEEMPGEKCEKADCKCKAKGEMKGKCGDGKCASGKCGEGMKEKMKGKCGEGMKEKMKGKMEGKCAAGKCGGK